ncbi:MAG TPA: diguanylate cyclase [Candidatus Methanoperedens sp.]|nr:diguanylate cyclase [Candidatus Methanoperedens sp.]
MAERRLILVVDDEPDILSLHRVILEGEGWQVITSGDGVDAIQKATDRLPDLIVLDVMMPRMNGYQVCRLLKNDPRTATIPIVICTVRTLESEKRYALTSGADEYLVKPFDPADLVRLVRGLLAGRPAPAGREGGAASRHPTSTDSILSDVNRLLDRRLMQLTILQHLAAAMAGTLHLDGVLGIVLQSIVTDLGYPGGMIFLVAEGGRLEERVAQSEPLVLDPERHPVFGRALAENRVVILQGEELLRDAPQEFCGRISAPAAILVPVRAKNRPIGLLVVESAAGVDRDQRDFLQTLANQSGLAIENANLYARTLQLSITDGLTGLFNYRHLRERLENEIARARRYRLPLGLLLIDIDRFKSFNDRFGHLLGDEVLKAVAHCIRSNTRDVDLVARYGGEEFCVILQEIGEGIRTHAERICEAVAAVRVALPGAGGGVTVSIGAAVSLGGEPGASELLRRADEALYRAKEDGRNRISVWDGRPDETGAAPAPDAP